MMLAFTTKRMGISAHLTLTVFPLTAQADFSVLDKYSYEKMHRPILHHWYGEMGSSQHKSPHQALTRRLGLDVVVTRAEMSPSRRTNDAVCIKSLFCVKNNNFFSWHYYPNYASSTMLLVRYCDN